MIQCSHEPKLIRDESGKPALYRCACGMWTWTLDAMAELIRAFREG